MPADRAENVRRARWLARAGQAAASQVQYEQAKEYYKQGLEIFASINDTLGTVEMLSNLGRLWVENLNNPVQAANLFGMDMILAIKSGDPALVMSVLDAICQSAWHLRKTEDPAALIFFAGPAILSPVREAMEQLELSQEMQACARLADYVGSVISYAGRSVGPLKSWTSEQALDLAQEVDRATKGIWHMKRFVHGE